MNIRLLISGALVALTATAAQAWNDRGHMIVAAKAWNHLDTNAKARVSTLLRHNPRYAAWTHGVRASDRSRVAFIYAATGPDWIKPRSNGYRQDQVRWASARLNTGYDDCNQHRYWHYKDIPFSPDGTALEATPEPNAETQINLFTSVLADPAASDELKAYDLVWLLHLVGDVHQPLHATARYIASDRDGDGGGNDVMICLTSQCTTGSALHAFWDDAFGGNETIPSVSLYARQLLAPNAAQAADLAPAHWLNESFELARSTVYRPPVADTLGPHLLTPSYRRDAAIAASQRVSLAGVRLANLINRANLQVRGDPVQPHRCPAT